MKKCPYCKSEIKDDVRKCPNCSEWLSDSSGSAFDPVHLMRVALAERFDIIRNLGSGASAVVYYAFNKKENREVALKVLHFNLISNREEVERFQREAKTGLNLTHNSIVKIYNIDNLNGYYFIEMEYLNGKNLRDYIKQKKQLSISETQRIITPIAQALGIAHSKGIIHRDIKSSNIIVTNDGRSVLTDFGIAHFSLEKTLTKTGTIMGTPEYMSPEQARGDKVDKRSDIYSLGVVTYECLTGRVPFIESNPLILFKKIESEPVPDPAKFNKKIADKYVYFLKKSMAKDPAIRYQNAKEFISALQHGESEFIDNSTVKIDSFQISSANTSKDQQKNLKYALIFIGLVAFVIFLFILKNSMMDNSGTYRTNNEETLTDSQNESFNEVRSVKPKTSIFVKSSPTGATIYLDGNNMGETPILLTGIELGDHILKAQLQNYYSREVSVSLNDKKEYSKYITLKPRPAHIKFIASPWAEVYLNNKKIGNTPISNYKLPPGKYSVTFRIPDYDTWKKIIELSPNEQVIISHAFKPFANVSINALPWGNIFIDGKAYGQTPKLIKNLTPGWHKIRVEHPTFGTQQKKIYLKNGELTNVAFSFK